MLKISEDKIFKIVRRNNKNSVRKELIKISTIFSMPYVENMYIFIFIVNMMNIIQKYGIMVKNKYKGVAAFAEIIMEKREYLVKNEYEVNKQVAFILLITAVFIVPITFALIYFRIFPISLEIAKVPLLIAFIVFITCYILSKFNLHYKRWFKYFAIFSCAIGIAAIFRPFKWNAYVVLSFPIILSSLYFDKRFVKLTFLFSVILYVGVDYLVQSDMINDGFFQDRTVMKAWIVSSISNVLNFIVILFATLKVVDRSRNIMVNLFDAEEQGKLLTKISTILDKVKNVSSTLNESASSLKHMANEATSSNEIIAANAGKTSKTFEDTISYIENASITIENISKDLKEISNESEVANEVGRNAIESSNTSLKEIQNTVEEMKNIQRDFEKNRLLIKRLGERSAEVSEISQVISSISSQTNLLALNAAIEAARAGDMGKGFAVVAEEVRKLAEKSSEAAKSISELIVQVLDDTNKAIEATENNISKVDNGLEMVKKSGEMFKETAQISEEVYLKLNNIADSNKRANDYSNTIVKIMENIDRLSREGTTQMQEIASSVEEQVASIQTVAASVNEVDKMASELFIVAKE